MRVRWPDVQKKPGKVTPRRIFVGPTTDLETGVALIVKDSGPGLQDDPTTLIQPFFTRRPDGMGLGLYYANLVMELCGGKLTFPSTDDVDLPDGFDGALVALEFQEVE
jgi:signal transduction histidine kinase